jgi:CelD/BcsL family acetyltransferase involved in cellulose biosynthesis
MPSAVGNLHLTVVHDVRTWETLEPEWRELFAKSEFASPPLSWDWLRGWWKHYGGKYGVEGESLRIITIRTDEEALVGALPLYVASSSPRLIGMRRLRFLSTGEAQDEETCAEYLDLLSVPGAENQCVELIRKMLTKPADGKWDELFLEAVSERSPLIRLLPADGSDRNSGDVRVERTCHIANLTGGLETYLGRVSAHQRKKLRRLLRAIDADHASLEVAANSADVSLFFDQMIDLHQRRWNNTGKPGCFASARFTAFHRELCQNLLSAESLILARLVRSGEPLGVIYGFVVRDRFHFYQCGLTNTPVGAIESPGTAAHLLLMDYLSKRGVVLYDFLGGTSVYKERLATEEHHLMRIIATKSTARTAFRRVYSPLRKMLRKVNT